MIYYRSIVVNALGPSRQFLDLKHLSGVECCYNVYMIIPIEQMSALSSFQLQGMTRASQQQVWENLSGSICCLLVQWDRTGTRTSFHALYDLRNLIPIHSHPSHLFLPFPSWLLLWGVLCLLLPGWSPPSLDLWEWQRQMSAWIGREPGGPSAFRSGPGSLV